MIPLLLCAAVAPPPLQDAWVRFIDASGEPIVGVVVELRPARGPTNRAVRLVTSGTGGRTRIRLDDVTTEAALVARKDGLCEARWMIPSRAMRTLVDPDSGEDAAIIELGDTVLRVPGTVRGAVVSKDGDLRVEGWTAEVRELMNDAGPHRVPVTRTGIVDEDTGTFEVTGVPSGPVRVSVVGDGGRRRPASVGARVPPGETVDVLVVDASADPDRRLRVDFRGPGRTLLRPRPEHVRAYDEQGREHLFEATRMGRPYELDDVEPGDYELEVTDPWFSTVRRLVSTGGAARLDLDGSASLVVEVVDVSGAQVENYSLAVEYVELARNTSRASQVLRAPGAEPGPVEATAGGGAAHRYEGVVPIELIVTARVEGSAPVRVVLADLQPNEARRLRLTCGPPITLEGRVLDASGAPVAGVDVGITFGELPGIEHGGSTSTAIRTPAGNRSVTVPAFDSRSVTDERGHFALTGLSEGRHVLSLRPSPLAIHDATLDLTRRIASEPYDVRLPPLGRVRLDVTGGTGERPAEAQWMPHRWSEDPAVPPLLWPTRTRGGRVLPKSDGTFGDAVVVAGAWDVFVRVPFSFEGEDVDVLFQRTAAVVPGDAVTNVRIELEHEWPARVRLVGGGPRTYATLVPTDGRATPPVGERARYLAAWRRDDRAEPRVTDLWVEPGEYVPILAGRGWSARAAAPITVGREDLEPIQLVVPLVQRTLQLVDAFGQPRPRVELDLWIDDATDARHCITTDDRGEFVVELPRGTLHVAEKPGLVRDDLGRLVPGWRELAQVPALRSLDAGQWATPSARALELYLPLAGEEGPR